MASPGTCPFSEYEITLPVPPKVCMGVLEVGTPFGK